MAGSRPRHCAAFSEGRSIPHERFRDHTHLGSSLDECDYKIRQLSDDDESPGQISERSFGFANADLCCEGAQGDRYRAHKRLRAGHHS